MFFTAVFMIELILKLIGQGLKRFCYQKTNIFDMLVLILTILELVLD